MIRFITLLAALLLMSPQAGAQPEQDSIPICTVYSLSRTCVEQKIGTRAYVRDADSATDCTTGNGTTLNACRFNGFGWVDDESLSGSGVTLAADGEVDAAKAVNAADPRLQSSFGLLIEAPSVLDDAALFSIASRAATITEVYCVTDAGTVDLNLEVRDRTTPDTAGTSVLSVDVTCDSDGALGTIASGAVTTDDILLWRISDVAGANRLNAMAR